ncbi:MAG TPA: AI-2E family transporter, partial [Candidatus Limnocylindria bacterium]|nr:AI-2E family transporter [Candidatus Limnocylindria bacterium]
MADLLGTLKRHRLGLFVLLVGLLLAWMLWSVKGALAAFIIGVALAFVLDPLVTFLQRRGVPRWGGVLVAYVAVVALVAAIVAYAIPPIAAQARDLISHMPQLSSALSDWQQALIDWYESLPLPPELREALDESIRNAQSALGGVLGEIVGPAIAA